jgi:hypothetical protein
MSEYEHNISNYPNNITITLQAKITCAYAYAWYGIVEKESCWS